MIRLSDSTLSLTQDLESLESDGLTESSYDWTGDCMSPTGVTKATIQLYSHNVFFLPVVAQVIAAGYNSVKSDDVRAGWIADNIITRGFDIVCLQEVFRAGPRAIISKKLQQEGYNTIDQFNTDGYLLINSGLYFASTFEIVHQDFLQFKAAQAFTSDYLSKKGIACAVVDTWMSSKPSEIQSDNESKGRYAAVFFTHTQAEDSGSFVRKEQLSESLKWILVKLSQLQSRFPIASTSVFLAGDLNADGLIRSAQTSDEYSTILSLLNGPHDLLRVARTDQQLEGVSSNSEGRLDHILAWKVHGQPATPTYSSSVEDFPLDFDIQSRWSHLWNSFHSRVVCTSTTVSSSSVFNYNLSILDRSHPVRVQDCEIEENWEAAPGLPPSDHHPVILQFTL